MFTFAISSPDEFLFCNVTLIARPIFETVVTCSPGRLM